MKRLLLIIILLGVIVIQANAQNCDALTKQRRVSVQQQVYINHSEYAPSMAHNRLIYQDNSDTLKTLSQFYHADSSTLVWIGSPITLEESVTKYDESLVEQQTVTLWAVREAKRLYLIGNTTYTNDITPYYHCAVQFDFVDGETIIYDEPLYSHYSNSEEIFILLGGKTAPYTVGDFTYTAKGDAALLRKLATTQLASISRYCSPPQSHNGIVSYEQQDVHRSTIDIYDATVLMNSIKCILKRR